MIWPMDAKSARTLNIRRFVKEAGGPTPFANKYGNGRWSQEQVSQWISEKQPKSIGNNLARDLEKVLGLSFGVFDTASDDAQPRLISAFHPDDPASDEEIRVPELRIEASGGHGRALVAETVSDREPATYRLSWFQKERINPDKARRFRVVGNSMEPMFFPGDSILVNLEETIVQDGFIYVFRQGNELKVKQLFRRKDSGLTLRSVNNAEYPDDVLSGADVQEQIEIIGRVRDRSGRGGLSGDFGATISSSTLNPAGIDWNVLTDIIAKVDAGLLSLRISLTPDEKTWLIKELYDLKRTDPAMPTERLLRLLIDGSGRLNLKGG